VHSRTLNRNSVLEREILESIISSAYFGKLKDLNSPNIVVLNWDTYRESKSETFKTSNFLNWIKGSFSSLKNDVSNESLIGVLRFIELDNQKSWNKNYYPELWNQFDNLSKTNDYCVANIINYISYSRYQFAVAVSFEKVGDSVALIFKIFLLKSDTTLYIYYNFIYHFLIALRIELFNLPPPFHFHLNNSINYCLLNIGNENELRKNKGYS